MIIIAAAVVYTAAESLKIGIYDVTRARPSRPDRDRRRAWERFVRARAQVPYDGALLRLHTTTYRPYI